MVVPPWAQQSGAEVRFEWGPSGVEAVSAPYVVIVDVLRFTTAVDAAVAHGAKVYPYRWKDASVAEFAARVGAKLASGNGAAGTSLSPARLSRLQAGDAVVLPSPNGSTCATIANETGATVVAASLRNAAAVAAWLNAVTREVAVVACGERWADGSLRPCLEDLLGAGAVIERLHGDRSPEAEAACDLWVQTRPSVDDVVRRCASGRELSAHGWDDDVKIACQVDVSTAVPVLMDGAFVDVAVAGPPRGSE